MPNLKAAQQGKSGKARTGLVTAGALVLSAAAAALTWFYRAPLAQQWRCYTVTSPYQETQFQPYVLSTAREQALKPGDAFKECAAECPAMIVMPVGSFLMGSSSSEPGHQAFEQPQHQVVIAKPFAVSKFELTFGQWDACAAYGDCDRHIGDSGFGRGRQPVINVTWDDARRYAAWLSKMTGKPYRLLSEAEYEYATRAGTQTVYPWGDEIGKNHANCNGCGSRWDDMQTAPAGSFPPNRFGLYDMVGNVFEWVEDCLHSDYGGAPTDGSAWIAGGACNGRMIRGGSWADDPADLRAADRPWNPATIRRNFIGFRVARTLRARSGSVR